MKRVLSVILLALLMTGCGTTRHLQHTVTAEHTDSLRVETVVQTFIVRDTAYVEVPVQTAERTTQDSTSRLENDYSVSNARINTDGSLYHDLATKPQKIVAPVAVEVEQRETNTFQSKQDVRTDYILRERELTKNEQLKLRWFSPVALLALLLLLWTLRKPILALMGKIA